MEYIPYKIIAGSYRINIYQNEFHGLRTFSSMEEGKVFLRNEAVEVVKYEESGKKAENCVYPSEKVLNDISDVKDGLFVEELEDGFILKHKVYESILSWFPTVTEKAYYMLAPLVRPMSKPTPMTKSKDNSHDNVIADLKSAFMGEGVKLKSTGLLEDLISPEKEEEPEEQEQEMYIKSYDDFEDMYDAPPLPPRPLRLPPLRELPPIPGIAIPVEPANIQIMLDKATPDTDAVVMDCVQQLNEMADMLGVNFEEIEKRCLQIDEEEKIIDSRLEEIWEEQRQLEEELTRIAEEYISESTNYDTEKTEESEESEESSSSSEESEESEESSSSSEEEETDEESSSFWGSETSDDDRNYIIYSV